MINLNDVNDMGTLCNLVSHKESQSQNAELLYVDFNYEPVEAIADTWNNSNVMTRNTNPDEYYGVVSPAIFTKSIQIDKEIDMKNIKLDFLKNVTQLGDHINNENSILFQNNPEVSDEENNIKLQNKINIGSSLVATNGRIGPANHILTSKKIYDEYNLELMDMDDVEPTPTFMNEEDQFGEEDWNNDLKKKSKKLYNFVLDDSINDIYLYRKNSVDQPGLLLTTNENKYEFVQIGFFPQKQFMKISIK